MFYFISSSLNPNEKNILIKLILAARIFPYIISEIEKNTLLKDLPDLDALKDKNNTVVLIADETKGKSVFIKRLEDLYGKDSLDQINIVLKMPKPSTFMKDPDKAEKIWHQIYKLKSKVKEINFAENFLGMELTNEAVRKINAGEFNTEFYLTLNNQIIEIRPDNAMPSKKTSLTVTEFLVLYYASKMFNFSAFDVFQSA